MSKRRSRWRRMVLLAVGYSVIAFSAFTLTLKNQTWIAYIVIGIGTVCVVFLDLKIFKG